MRGQTPAVSILFCLIMNLKSKRDARKLKGEDLRGKGATAAGCNLEERLQEMEMCWPQDGELDQTTRIEE